MAFSAFDRKGNSDTTDVLFVYKQFNDDELPSRSVHTGKEQNDYRIISIPYQLQDMSVNSIFADDFGNYDKTNWRFFSYNGTSYNEMQSGSLTLGAGYWLISSTTSSFDLGAGSSPQYNRNNLFRLSLNGDWNLIGNPYPFTISWQDILNYNGIESGIGNLKFYTGSTSNPYEERDNMNPFEGAFVFSSAGDINLDIPVISSDGGNRKTENIFMDNFDRSIDKDSWYLKLDLTSDSFCNHFGGIGMHPAAENQIDGFDDFTLPPFMTYLDINHNVRSKSGSPVTRSIVKTANQYTWEFEVATNLSNDIISLSWNQKLLEDQISSLYLYDLTNNIKINMKENESYTFSSSPETRFKILFARDPSRLLDDFETHPYPNPFNSEIFLPVLLEPNTKNSELVLSVTTINGRLIKELKFVTAGSDFFELSWDGMDRNGNEVAQGIYFLHLKIINEGIETGNSYFRVVKE
jgi:hypothetical protein